MKHLLVNLGLALQDDIHIMGLVLLGTCDVIQLAAISFLLKFRFTVMSVLCSLETVNIILTLEGLNVLQ